MSRPASRGRPEPGCRRRADVAARTSITGRAAASRQVIAAPDARQHPAYIADPGHRGRCLRLADLGADGSAPGRQPEVLVASSTSSRCSGGSSRTTRSRSCRRSPAKLAIGIENARLYSRTDARLQRKIAELGTMQRVSHTIASTLDLDDVLRLIAEQAVALFNVEAASIFRFLVVPRTPLGRRSAIA